MYRLQYGLHILTDCVCGFGEVTVHKRKDQELALFRQKKSTQAVVIAKGAGLPVNVWHFSPIPVSDRAIHATGGQQRKQSFRGHLVK